MKFIIQNWKSIVGILSVAWSSFCFIYIIYGLPQRVSVVEDWIAEYKLEKLPPRVSSLEYQSKEFEKDIASIRLDVKENNVVSQQTYTLVKELRDHFVYEALQNGHKK